MNCSFMAGAPSRTSPIPGPCQSPTQSAPPLPTFSTRWSRPFPTRDWNLTSKICSGRALTCSTAWPRKISRDLDSNEQAQKRAQREQDGSEVRSVELETLIAEGITLIERRNAYETMRDLAAELFETHLGQTWHPHAGSHVNRRTLTASLIDSRDHIAAKRRADIEPLLPQGTKIAFTGGLDCTDHTAIWEALDRVRTKHSEMVLLHGGAPRGAERIAAAWADNRGVTQIVFKPDWTRHGKSAPFKRNDRLLDTLPVGVIVFPGSGITDNLSDKARTMGIPLFDFRPKANREA